PLARTLLTMADDYLERQRRRGKRDYTDQLLDTIELFKKNREAVPRYEHVLVDEYQDVNDQQITLLELLEPANLFCVGDPRQSIYGWRGSKLDHILAFPERHPKAAVIQLTKNYRCAQDILDLCNDVIKKTGYPDLQATTKERGVITIKHHATEDEQVSAVTKAIKGYQGDKRDIFVLARTNKALEKVQRALAAHGIDYLLRTDELKRTSIDPKQDQVTLATIHAIKGLEAKHVHVINANTNNFPCKASDHPVMDLFHLHDDYDSYAEELRVLYVALSRARQTLHISYTGAPTTFLPATTSRPAQRQLTTSDDAAALMHLRRWRYRQAEEKGVPAYVICPDNTLEALITQKPRTPEELSRIPGLGPHRVATFGDALLEQLTLL
ncbi:exodeoxyribonuclease V subunit gamma, partial [Candidatus Woesearchaeota archaeon]|nr:exodeoxyribonuclease V subunit gamma [Candidatus Woesearchaeota archaeon]